MLDKLIRVTATFMLLGTVLGCDSNEDESSSQSESEKESGGVQAAQNDQATDLDLDKKDKGFQKGDEALAKQTRKQAKMKKAIGDAIKAATAAEEGDTPCDTAFNAMAAMATSMDESTGEDNKNKLPSRKEFVSGCSELPETVRKCMAPSYMMKNRQQCDEAKKNMDPEVQKKMAELMKKKDG